LRPLEVYKIDQQKKIGRKKILGKRIWPKSLARKRIDGKKEF